MSFLQTAGQKQLEGALKAARKYAKQKGNGACELIAMEHSFHGRSMGALSVTGTESYREPFEPLVGGVKFAAFNDLESVKKQVTEKTGAILLGADTGRRRCLCGRTVISERASRPL